MNTDLAIAVGSCQPAAHAEKSNTTNQQAMAQYAKLPLIFEENHGQVDDRAQFTARGPGYQLYLGGSLNAIALESPEGTSNAVHLRSNIALTERYWLPRKRMGSFSSGIQVIRLYLCTSSRVMKGGWGLRISARTAIPWYRAVKTKPSSCGDLGINPLP